MDVETFAQCLQYIQVTKSSFSAEKLIPVGAAFGGAIIGFGLNYLSSTRKENKTSKNKEMCCKEDVEKIKKSTHKVVTEICNLCIIVNNRARPSYHQVPLHVSSLCLDEYFIDVAHKFSKSQRESVQMLLSSLKTLNNRLPALTEGGSFPTYTYSTMLLNIALGAMEIWSHCEDFTRDQIVNYTEAEMLEWLSLTNDQIISFQALKENASACNTILKFDQN